MTAASVLTERDRRHNDRTYKLDRAQRLFELADRCELRGQYLQQREALGEAARILQPIAHLLTIDPEALL